MRSTLCQLPWFSYVHFLVPNLGWANLRTLVNFSHLQQCEIEPVTTCLAVGECAITQATTVLWFTVKVQGQGPFLCLTCMEHMGLATIWLMWVIRSTLQQLPSCSQTFFWVSIIGWLDLVAHANFIFFSLSCCGIERTHMLWCLLVGGCGSQLGYQQSLGCMMLTPYCCRTVEILLVLL